MSGIFGVVARGAFGGAAQRHLGVDAAGDAREERDRRGAEAEAGEALHRLLVHGLGLALELERREDEEARRDAEEAEADDGEAHHGARRERHLKAVVERRLLVVTLAAGARRRGLAVAVGGDHHAPPARARRQRGARDERDRDRRRDQRRLGGVEEGEEGAGERQHEDGEVGVLHREELDRAVAHLRRQLVDQRALRARVAARVHVDVHAGRVRVDLHVQEADEDEGERRGGERREDDVDLAVTAHCCVWKSLRIAD